MDGYKLLADSYKKSLEQHPEFDEEQKASMERQIRNLERLIGTDDKDRDELFNSGAFNDICKGYFRTAMKNCKLDDKTISAVIEEFKWLLDTMSAGEARTK